MTRHDFVEPNNTVLNIRTELARPGRPHPFFALTWGPGGDVGILLYVARQRER